jgi:hypothetical protein
MHMKKILFAIAAMMQPTSEIGCLHSWNFKPEEDARIKDWVNEHGPNGWDDLASQMPERSVTSLKSRWFYLRPDKKHGPWTPEEDELLRIAVWRYGNEWNAAARDVPGRSGKQIRDRWFNHLRPDIKHGPWTPEEDQLLRIAIRKNGEDWNAAARDVPGRTGRQTRDRWNILSLPANSRLNYWMPQEEQLLLEMAEKLHYRWDAVAAYLPRHSSVAVKSRWYKLNRQHGQTDGLSCRNGGTPEEN